MRIVKEDFVDAVFSEHGTHRFILMRIWEEGKPIALFIGLNPSRSLSKLGYGPTTNRIVEISKRLGYGGIYIVNLFSYISIKPEKLTNMEENDEYLRYAITDCKDVFFIWGSNEKAKERAQFVIDLYPQALCLGKNKDGSPKHPLHVSPNVKPIKYV